MLLTIYNLPENTRYADVKSLIQSKCGLTEMILDNLLATGPDTKKVTVGLAEEEDAAILVRKINGLYINGKQLFVEDVRKRKSTEQPYCSTRNNPQDDHQTTQPYHQTAQLYQQNTESYNPGTQSYYMAHIGQATSTDTTPYASFYMQPYTQQTAYVPYGEQQEQVQYPPPQACYQATSQDQEPLGFRAEPSESQQSRGWGRNDRTAKKSFQQKDDKRSWSPERESWNYNSSQYDQGSGRTRERRDRSPPRDRRRNDERDDQFGASRSGYARDRSSNDYKREPERRSFGHDRGFEQKPKNNAKVSRWSEPKPLQPWENSNSGSSQTKDWGNKSNYLAKRAKFEGNNDAPLPKKIKQNSPRTKMLDPVSKEKQERQIDTWIGQATAAVYKDCTQFIEVPREVFFVKELKRMIRERITDLNCGHKGPVEMIAKYQRKYKPKDDKILIERTLDKLQRLQEKQAAELSEANKANEGEAVEEGGKPSDQEPVFKVPQNPDIKKVTVTKPQVTAKKPLQAKESNKPLTGKAFIKEQKKETKLIFANEKIITESLDPKMADALEAETTGLLQKFVEASQNDGKTDAKFLNRLTTTVANDFKKVLKVQLAQRIGKVGMPTVRVFCAPKMINRRVMEPLLASEGVTFLKKSDKHPMILASCSSWGNHDRLCSMEPLKVHGKTITFKPLQVAGPPLKITKDAIKAQRKRFIDNQIDDGNASGENDAEFDIVDDAEIGPEDCIDNPEDYIENPEDYIENPEDYIENPEDSSEEQTDETNIETDNAKEADSDIVKIEKVMESKSNPTESSTEASDTIATYEESLNDVKFNEQGNDAAPDSYEDFTSDVKIDDFTDDVTNIDKDKETTADDYKIVEDTMGNFNNNDDGVETSSGAVQGDGEDANGDEGVDANCEDIEIGDIDENDLEDY